MKVWHFFQHTFGKRRSVCSRARLYKLAVIAILVLTVTPVTEPFKASEPAHQAAAIVAPVNALQRDTQSLVDPGSIESDRTRLSLEAVPAFFALALTTRRAGLATISFALPSDDAFAARCPVLRI